MLIGIDIDDVLADFVPALAVFHNKYYGTSYKKEDFKSYRFAETWGGSLEDAISKVALFLHSEEHNNLKPVRGAVKAVNILKKQHKLYVITSRQQSLKDLTIQWLNKYYPNSFSDVYFAHNHYISSGKSKQKHEFCVDLRVDYMIEDSSDYALQCAKHTNVIILDKPWNQNSILPSKILRASNWREIVSLFEERKC